MASATVQRMAEPQVQSAAAVPTNSGMSTGQIEQQREIIAQEHAHDSSSVATSRADQPRVLLRSPIMWGTLYLPGLALIAIVAYMVAHLRAHDPGRVPGAGDRASPHAQPGDK